MNQDKKTAEIDIVFGNEGKRIKRERHNDQFRVSQGIGYRRDVGLGTTGAQSRGS